MHSCKCAFAPLALTNCPSSMFEQSYVNEMIADRLSYLGVLDDSEKLKLLTLGSAAPDGLAVVCDRYYLSYQQWTVCTAARSTFFIYIYSFVGSLHFTVKMTGC